ncbi:hypothetical protein ACWGLE_01250 [Streptomyces sp. NPDC055897]
MTDTSPAGELQAAAERLRALASDATPGVWHVTEWQQDDCGYEAGIGTTPGDYDVVGHGYEGGGVERLADARYIAALHPGVGAALADWLDSWSGIEVREDAAMPEDLRHALAVARKINGSQP